MTEQVFEERMDALNVVDGAVKEADSPAENLEPFAEQAPGFSAYLREERGLRVTARHGAAR